MTSKADEDTQPMPGLRSPGRRPYPLEFRRQVARFIRETGASIDEVRHTLGVTRNTINSWLTAFAHPETTPQSALRDFAAAPVVPVESDADSAAADHARDER